jgi:subtilisin family serine protease
MRKICLTAIVPFLFGCLAALPLLAQDLRRPNWQNLDLQHDSVFGISTERAYRELLAGKQAQTVIVAVIDRGVDTSHEDLKGVLWVNPRELPGNGLDDDHNGYIDDIHGWNFVGGAKGNVLHDTYEATRIIDRDSAKYAGYTVATVPEKERAGFAIYWSARQEYDSLLTDTRHWLQIDSSRGHFFDSLCKSIGKDSLALADLERVTPRNEFEKLATSWAIWQMKHTPGVHNISKYVAEFTQSDHTMLDYGLNTSYNPRALIIGDDYHNDWEQYYGNANVAGVDALHGTHVSGIIAAIRGNGLGIDGIADHVRIMTILAVPPSGDERDKDVANAIRYAAANGARVIDLSFGKYNSWNKKVVDAAVKYAMSQDVLIVHSAGNSGRNIDDPPFGPVPSEYYEDGHGKADAWITVGASDQADDSTLVASFSNYGKTRVDVFAPGAAIYSCVPGSKYDYENGTSMAAPVVAGLAALIREYYPKLTAVQVKEIIMRSVVKPTHTVNIQDGKTTKKVLLSDICTSGGVVNAYNALKLAASYTSVTQIPSINTLIKAPAIKQMYYISVNDSPWPAGK